MKFVKFQKELWYLDILIKNKINSLYVDMKSNIKTLAALALVNGEVWDMHRPLESDCSLEFLKFRDSEPAQLNRVISAEA